MEEQNTVSTTDNHFDETATQRHMEDSKLRQKIYAWVRCVRGKIIGEQRRAVYDIVTDPVSLIANATKVMEQPMLFTEDVLVVEIPVRELTTMAETQDWYKRHIGGFSMPEFDKIIRDKDYEKHLRGENPGLQAAWEQYQIMLALCSNPLK